MKVSILLVIVSLLLVAETAVYRRESESKDQHDSDTLDSPEGNEGGCNSITPHDVLLGVNKYFLTTCYNGMHNYVPHMG